MYGFACQTAAQKARRYLAQAARARLHKFACGLVPLAKAPREPQGQAHLSLPLLGGFDDDGLPPLPLVGGFDDDGLAPLPLVGGFDDDGLALLGLPEPVGRRRRDLGGWWPDAKPTRASARGGRYARPLCLGNARANTRGPTRRDVGRGGSRARTGEGGRISRLQVQEDHGPDAGPGRLGGVAVTSHRFEARLSRPLRPRVGPPCRAAASTSPPRRGRGACGRRRRGRGRGRPRRRRGRR